MAGPDTMESEYDLPDGVDGLSLREALVMANNTESEDLILFNSEVFGAGSEAVITLDTALPTLTGNNVFIDASERDVQLVAADSGILRIEANNVHIGGLEFISTGTVSPIEVDGANVLDLLNNRYQSVAPAINATGTNLLTIGGSEYINVESDAIVVSTSTNLTIRDNTFEELLERALRVSDSQSVLVERNSLVHVGGDQMTFGQSSEVTVNDNDIIIDNKTAQKGVRFDEVVDSRVTNNFIDPGTAHLVSLSGSSNNLIEGNILDRGDAGVVLEGGSTDNLIIRNVIIGSAYDGIYVSSACSDNTVVHNTVHNARSALVFSSDTVTSGNNLITSDTDEDFFGYVDPANYDYTLLPGHPAIDAGEEMGYDCLPGSDELFWDAAPDLGAIETNIDGSTPDL